MKEEDWDYITVDATGKLQHCYRSGTVNSNTVNSKFHLIRSYYEIFFYHSPNISCLKCTVNSNLHLIRSKTLLMNDFELTIPNLYLDLYKILCRVQTMSYRSHYPFTITHTHNRRLLLRPLVVTLYK